MISMSGACSSSTTTTTTAAATTPPPPTTITAHGLKRDNQHFTLLLHALYTAKKLANYPNRLPFKKP